MTYCLGIVTKYGLIMASDSRSNAGYDQVNTTRKMHTFVQPGEHVYEGDRLVEVLVDGATFDVIKPLALAGKLPHF